MPEGNPIPIIIECLLLQFIVCTNRSPYVGRLFTVGSTHSCYHTVVSVVQDSPDPFGVSASRGLRVVSVLTGFSPLQLVSSGEVDE